MNHLGYGTVNACQSGDVLRKARKRLAGSEALRVGPFARGKHIPYLAGTPKLIPARLINERCSRRSSAKANNRARIQNEIEALELVIPLLTDDQRQAERKAESFSEAQNTGTEGPFFGSIGETESHLWNTGKRVREGKK